MNYAELDLISPVPAYGPSFKVLALAWCASRAGPSTLVQLDSDTVFLSEPDFRPGDRKIAVRPVDVPGICSGGPADPRDEGWRAMARSCGVDLDALSYVLTTIGGSRVRASYNGGLVAATRSFFTLVETCFLRIVGSGAFGEGPAAAFRAGAGLVDAEGAAFWGTSQAAISLAAVVGGHPVRLLGDDHNVPAHMLDDLHETRRVTHLHYHWMYSELATRRVLHHPRLVFTSEQRAWLAKHVAGAAAERRGSSVAILRGWTKRLLRAGWSGGHPR